MESISSGAQPLIRCLIMADYLRNVDEDWYRQRLTRALLCVVAAFMVLLARLFFLQLVEGPQYQRLSENNRIRLQTIEPPRGLILDRNHSRLVDNRPAFDLHIVLKDARPVDQTLQKLARYAAFSLEDLKKTVAEAKGLASYKPILLKQDIGWEALAAIETHRYDLPGVQVDAKPRRNYIHNHLAAHLLGYLGEINPKELAMEKYKEYRSGDFVGKFGVEKVFEKQLRGQRGGRQVEVDATGQVYQILNTVQAVDGANLYLTIDAALQRKAEALLKDRAGAVVAVDPANGEILALASSPSFDQNMFVDGINTQQWRELRDNPFRPMENKTTQAQYPPASTYKIVTAIAALEEGVIDENTTVFCPGHYRFGDRVFRCWRKQGHGHVNVEQALEQSCDVFFYQAGQKLGVDRLAWYAKACGLGSATGIELDHESPGLIPTAAWKRARTGVPWQRGETLSIAIGQGYNLTTPLQMAMLTAAVANGGTRYKPQLLKRLETPAGEVKAQIQPHPLGELPAKPATMEIVKHGLWMVVNGKRGTARKIRIKDIEICGKTGTAQIFSRKGPETVKEEDRPLHKRSHAWFVAYAPMHQPRIAIAIIVEHGEHGSSAAAPIAKELIRQYLLPTAQVAQISTKTQKESLSVP